MTTLIVVVVCRPPAALGLEQPCDAAESPIPEPQREPDVAALETRPGATTTAESLVPGETPAPTSSKVQTQGASGEQVEGDNPKIEKATPKIPLGEPIEPPPPAGACLPEAQLPTTDGVIGTPQQ
jgi:hypothetical protein